MAVLGFGPDSLAPSPMLVSRHMPAFLSDQNQTKPEQVETVVASEASQAFMRPVANGKY